MSSYWKGDECICITCDPYHKKKGLYVGNKYCIQRIATFTNDETADYFDEYFAKFLGIEENKNDNNDN